jgi:hypothetical protein
MIVKMAAISETDETIDDNYVPDECEQICWPGSTFQTILDTGSKSHIRWLLTTTLMKNIVNRYDAVIFGGAVRDLLLHQYTASKFYNLCNFSPCVNLKNITFYNFF